MLEHWQAIVAAVIVGVMAILTRYMFVMKKDCKDHRENCNRTICGKIDLLRTQAKDTASAAVVIDKEAKQTLKEINSSILEISKDLAKLEGSFNRFLHEFDKRNGKPV